LLAFIDGLGVVILRVEMGLGFGVEGFGVVKRDFFERKPIRLFMFYDDIFGGEVGWIKFI